MSNPSAGAGDVFDVRKIRRLVELMNEHELNEIDLRQADMRIRLRRGDADFTGPVEYVPARAAAPAAPVAPAAAAPAGDSAASDNFTYINSPMVGTFYLASSPDSAPFVKVSDHVGPDTIVCIVEAMKVFNEIPAEISGRVVSVLAENGEPVEFGQPLFKIDPKG
ncbi:MAG: acetyl-CoA carboxylase biotin carboxyl carrier protein [Pirellulales bacterium]